MKKIKGLTPLDIVRRGLFQGKNDVQILLMVRDLYPKYEDKKIRHLISVERGKYKRT